MFYPLARPLVLVRLHFQQCLIHLRHRTTAVVAMVVVALKFAIVTVDSAVEVAVVVVVVAAAAVVACLLVLALLLLPFLYWLSIPPQRPRH